MEKSEIFSYYNLTKTGVDTVAAGVYSTQRKIYK